MTKLVTKWMTINQFVISNDGGWPSSAASVRAMVFNASRGRNNFQSAFKKIGRRVLVDPEAFFRCLSDEQYK